MADRSDFFEAVKQAQAHTYRFWLSVAKHSVHIHEYLACVYPGQRGYLKIYIPFQNARIAKLTFHEYHEDSCADPLLVDTVDTYDIEKQMVLYISCEIVPWGKQLKQTSTMRRDAHDMFVKVPNRNLSVWNSTVEEYDDVTFSEIDVDEKILKLGDKQSTIS